jgi:AraC-like DNA-binding protein
VDWAPGYREFAPPARFRGELHCLWFSVIAAHGVAQVSVLPDACTDLIWQSDVGAYVAGPDTGPNPAQLPSPTVVVGVRFRPGTGGAALGLPLSELLDQRVDAADVPAVPVRRLPGSLAPAEALRRLSGIAAELVTERPPDRLVLEAARRLGRPGERADLLAEQLGISERQLRRRCLAAVGYGPRMISRVLRFRRFLSRIDVAGAAVDLAGLAAETGYADQAHMTRESTRLAGLPPAALARERAAGRTLAVGGRWAEERTRAEERARAAGRTRAGDTARRG